MSSGQVRSEDSKYMAISNLQVQAVLKFSNLLDGLTMKTESSRSKSQKQKSQDRATFSIRRLI